MRGLAVVLVLAFALVACSESSPSPESVVRAWSHALNDGDNERAASLFAPDARVVQAGTTLRLHTQQDAVSWNESLPCSGQIVRISASGDMATATFLLGDRKTSACDAPGATATAVFTVKRGKIVLWHQTGASRTVPPPQV